MKPLYLIVLIGSVCIFSWNIFAQDNPQNRRQRQSNEQKDSGLPQLSARAESKNADQTQDIENVVWLKEIYREIDLNKEANAPLYYPVQPIGNRMNLATLIFKLMGENKIKGYTYMDGREIFTSQYEVKFEDILKKTGTLYNVERKGNENLYRIEDGDIPSNEITLYTIKEAWYFNQANGTFDKKILAICPMLIREEYDLGGAIERTALFWIPYENIRPYISQSLIMTSNVNNALTYTTDDFFRKGMYEGDIVKTTNLMNQPLLQIYGDSIKVAQDSIENQLKFFEKQLWIPEDSTQVASGKKGKDSKKSSSSSSSKDEDKKEDKKEETKESKPKKTKTEKSSSSSSPSKSVRRTR